MAVALRLKPCMHSVWHATTYSTAGLMPFCTAVVRLGFEQRALAMHVPNWTRDGQAGVGGLSPPLLYTLFTTMTVYFVLVWGTNEKIKKRKRKRKKTGWLQIYQEFTKLQPCSKSVGSFSCLHSFNLSAACTSHTCGGLYKSTGQSVLRPWYIMEGWERCMKLTIPSKYIAVNALKVHVIL